MLTEQQASLGVGPGLQQHCLQVFSSLPCACCRLPLVGVLLPSTAGCVPPAAKHCSCAAMLPACLMQEQGCDAKIASGGGRMGVTMDRCERCAALACCAVVCLHAVLPCCRFCCMVAVAGQRILPLRLYGFSTFFTGRTPCRRGGLEHCEEGLGGACAGRGAPLLQGRADRRQDAAGELLSCKLVYGRPSAANLRSLRSRCCGGYWSFWCAAVRQLILCVSTVNQAQKEGSDKSFSYQWLGASCLISSCNQLRLL